jgi:hypothetical protein
MLNFLSMFDWITPVTAFARDAAHGGAVTHFSVPIQNHTAVCQAMRRAGVESWGHQMVDDWHMMFTVADENAATVDRIVEGL